LLLLDASARTSAIVTPATQAMISKGAFWIVRTDANHT
jgi:hypothetical protein